MKRYIIETDAQRIWSYEVEAPEAGFACKLMKPHGDKTYAMEDRVDYWDWFKDEASLLPGEEIDLCFLCSETAQAEFELFFQQKPQFCYPEQTSWTVAELELFFHEYREQTMSGTVHYEKELRRLVFPSGQVVLARGLGDGDLETSVEVVQTKEEKLLPQQCGKKPKVKVYSPAKEQQTVPQSTDVPPKAVEKPKQGDEKIPRAEKNVRKADGEDFQIYIEKRIEGQCRTVNYRTDMRRDSD